MYQELWSEGLYFLFFFYRDFHFCCFRHMGLLSYEEIVSCKGVVHKPPFCLDQYCLKSNFTRLPESWSACIRFDYFHFGLCMKNCLSYSCCMLTLSMPQTLPDNQEWWSEGLYTYLCVSLLIFRELWDFILERHVHIDTAVYLILTQWHSQCH